MSNVITEIFTNLPDEELRQAISEMREDEELGIIRNDGYVRRITHRVHQITGESVSVLLFLTQTNLLREAAFRFIR